MSTSNLLKSPCSVANFLTTHTDSMQQFIANYTHNWPFYASVDIRDAGFKLAVVDHNLFPAGFNNLDNHAYETHTQYMRDTLARYPMAHKRILLLCEFHTRNTFYLENIRVLKNLMHDSGYHVTLSMVMPDHQPATTMIVTTATNQSMAIQPFTTALGNQHDSIILNNDLSSGIPDSLATVRVPVIPTPQAGWHTRRKSHYFAILNQLMARLIEPYNCDPWLYSTLTDSIAITDITEDKEKLYDKVTKLFHAIQRKYTEYGIQEKPFVFIKSDNGTYGMGVHVIESPEASLTLNRKARNTLSRGKSSQKITQLLIQEGVPSVQTSGLKTAETCIYMLGSHSLGGFHRVNSHDNRSNLNKQGMTFESLASRNTTAYTAHELIAQLANCAAATELTRLTP